MKPLRLGIIGPGLIWRRTHRPALEKLSERVTLAAFSGTSEKTRRRVEQEYPGVPFFTDYKALVQSPDVDAVVVLTPIPLNAPVANAALRAGKDVFMEKPMAHSVEEAEELVRTLAQSGRRLFVLEQDGYRAATRVIAELLNAGEIGEPVLWEEVAHGRFERPPDGSESFGATEWRIHPEFPLGTLFDGGHHNIARLAELFGPPRALCASGYNRRPDYGEYDQVLAFFEYEGPLRGVLSHSSYLGGERNYFYIRGTDGLIQVEHDKLIVVRTSQGERTIPLPQENPWDVMWPAYLDALETGEEPHYSYRSALRDLYTLDAISRAAKSGAKVSPKAAWVPSTVTS